MQTTQLASNGEPPSAGLGSWDTRRAGVVFGAVVEGAEGWREASDVAFQGAPISSGYGWPRLQLPRRRMRDWAHRAEIHGLLHVLAWCIPERADWPQGAASPTNTCACWLRSSIKCQRQRQVRGVHGSLSTVSGRARRGGDQPHSHVLVPSLCVCLSFCCEPATGAPISHCTTSLAIHSHAHIISHDSSPLATCYTPIDFSAVLCLVSCIPAARAHRLIARARFVEFPSLRFETAGTIRPPLLLHNNLAHVSPLQTRLASHGTINHCASFAHCPHLILQNQLRLL